MRSRGLPGWLFWVLVAAVTALAAWARVTNFEQVFTPDGTLLKPTDSHYYVRFALLQLEAFPSFVRFDPMVNFPDGARIYWPPVHTWAVSLLILLDPSRPETMAAWTGPALSVLWFVALAGLLRRTLGPARALALLALLALMRGAVVSGELGNVDHHVHEPYLALALACLLIETARTGERRWAMALGLLLGLSRLLTTLTVVLLPCVVMAFAALGLAARGDGRERLASLAGWTGGVAAGVFTLSARLWGDLGSLAYVATSGFLPLTSIAGFFGAAALMSLLGGRRRRALAWGAPALLCAAVVSREALGAGGDFGRDDPLLQVISESQPIWAIPEAYLLYLGAAGLFLPIALVVSGIDAARRRAVDAIVPLLFTGVLLAAFALQLRFVQAFVGPLALLLATALPKLFDDASSRLVRTGVAVIGLCGLSYLGAVVPTGPSQTPSDEAMVRQTMKWLRDNTPSPPDYAIVATHDVGHLLTLWAERPNVSSPFSQAPWHLAGNARSSAVLGATDDEAAYEAARATGARYVLVVPFAAILGRDGSKDDATMARRLLEHAAMGEGWPVTAHFRLLHDSREERLRTEKGPYARVFEVVPGAELVGRSEPGAVVRASLSLRTNLRAPLRYVRETRADASGAFALRVAYPSEPAGEVVATGPYEVQAGEHTVHVEVREADVREGRAVPVPEAAADAILSGDGTTLP